MSHRRKRNDAYDDHGNQGNQVKVEVRGWEGGSRDDLVAFLLRKANIRLMNPSTSGPVLSAYVKKFEAAPLLKFSGIRFAGAPLKITLADGQDGGNGGASSGKLQTVEMLRNFLSSRYNEQAKYLDLQALRHDQYLVSNNLFSSASTESKMFVALMKVAEDLRNVETVSLADNDLIDVNWVTTLAQTYPGLKNLSLANNRIAGMRGLEPWRHKFRQLRELILAGNPLVTNEPTYKDQVLRMFPRLVILDGQVVRDESQLDVLRLPQPVRQTFFENPDIQSMATGFVANYFRLFDEDRQQLLQLYDDASTFSLSVNSGAPRVLISNPKPQSWSAYISLSRNLQKVTTVTARNNRLYTGPQAIGGVFRRLPPTKHDLAQAHKFSIEAWRVPDVRVAGDTGVMICVHGEYDEPQNIIRSFDRTFIVLQGPAGNMIVSADIMTVRAWAGSDAWKETGSHPGTPGGTPVPTGPPPPANSPAPGPGVSPVPQGIPPELNGLTPEQISIVEKLMIETRLNAQYARMCAEQANFDLGQAAALFQQSRAQLPPNAFQ